MNKHKYYDYVVIGAGIVGLSIAKELTEQFKDASILVIEKEAHVGCHASGRNSGVLHSGIYYPSHSYKAKVCITGSKLMANYCRENGLAIREVGKVIVPVEESEDLQLDYLYKQGIDNGVNVEMVDKKQLFDIECNARTASNRALFIRDVSVVDSNSILNHLVSHLVSCKVNLAFDSIYKIIDLGRSLLKVNSKTIKYGFLFNAAGQHADKVAHSFGAGENYTMIPFRGSYYKLNPSSQLDLKRLIYPVPDLNMPFLGVHTLTNIHGDTYFGPSAIPAFGREHYSWLKGIRLFQGIGTLMRLSRMYLQDKNIRYYMNKEATILNKKQFLKSVKRIVPSVSSENLLASDKVGIRAQLFNKKANRLEMDFVVENIGNSVHVLNAVSPAFTSAFSMAKDIVLRS